jgi:hypothetical protein
MKCAKCMALISTLHPAVSTLDVGEKQESTLGGYS